MPTAATQDEVRRLAGMPSAERIGRDLHDLLGHTLSVWRSRATRRNSSTAIRRQRARRFRDVENVAREALAQVREAVAGIRATGLESEIASARLALLTADIRLDQRLAPIALDAAVEQALAMAVRATTNVIRTQTPSAWRSN